jgi:ethanolamine transporter EutH
MWIDFSTVYFSGRKNETTTMLAAKAMIPKSIFCKMLIICLKFFDENSTRQI